MNNKSIMKTYELTKEQAVIYTLSPTLKQIIALTVQGYSNDEIGDILHITAYTVKAHIAKILKKTKIKNRTQLAYIVGCLEDKSDFIL